MSEVSEGEVLKGVFEVENESKDELKDEVSFEVWCKVGGWKDVKESMAFLKDEDPFSFLKIVLAFLSSTSALENLVSFSI